MFVKLKSKISNFNCRRNRNLVQIDLRAYLVIEGKGYVVRFSLVDLCSPFAKAGFEDMKIRLAGSTYT